MKITTTSLHALLFARNLVGSLTQEQIERVYAFFDNPNTETWDDIARMVILPDGTTIWMALLENFH
jgi:hypothetical protein